MLSTSPWPALAAALVGCMVTGCTSVTGQGAPHSIAPPTHSARCAAPGKQPPVVWTGRLVQWCAMPSAHVAARTVTIWLPPGYDTDRTRRWPVIYTHDGQNAFSAGTSNFDQEWRFDETLDAMARAGSRAAAIVVAIDSAPHRHREYLPEAWLRRLPSDIIAGVQDIDRGPPLADAYLRFVTTELMPRVDSTFRTRADRGGRSIIGASMGGLISLYAAIEYPDLFGAAAALSSHWPLRAPPGEAPGPGGPDARDVAAIAAAVDGWLADRRPAPGRTRLYLDHGTATLDGWYPAYAAAIGRVLQARGFVPGPDYMDRRFTGAAHDETAWSERLDIPLLFLSPGD